VNTIEQVAEYLKLSYRGVLLLIKAKRINAVKVGKRWLITDEELERIKKMGA